MKDGLAYCNLLFHFTDTFTWPKQAEHAFSRTADRTKRLMQAISILAACAKFFISRLGQRRRFSCDETMYAGHSNLRLLFRISALNKCLPLFHC